MALKKKQGRPIANSQPERRSVWKPLEFDDNGGRAQRPGMFEIKPIKEKPAVKTPPESMDSTGRVAVPIPEESDEVKVRRRLTGMMEDVRRKSIPPPPLKTVRETMAINRKECEIYDGEISIVEDDDYLELSSWDIEEIKSVETFRQEGFFKTLLRNIDDFLDLIEKKIDAILKL